MNRTHPLPSRPLPKCTSIAQTAPWASAGVDLETPATSVMTDLTRIKAATIAPEIPLRQVEAYMSLLGVHMLFVVDEAPYIAGLITSTDLHGGRPLQALSRIGSRYDDLVVRDVMTPRDEIDAIYLLDLQSARVTNVVATLKERGRNHLLVVDSVSGAAKRVRGVISRSQVERQLGESIDVIDVACCFASVVRMLA